LFSYYIGTGTAAVDSDIMRDLAELTFIEDYHWTPEYISTIPYKWIQKHMYIKRVRSTGMDAKRLQEQLKTRSASSAGPAGLRPGEKSFIEL